MEAALKIRHVFGLLALFICVGESASAASVNIVALGASNTYGSGIGKSAGTGVSPSEAFPAQLENLLKTRGIDAHVSNAGVPGDTTSAMYGRLGSAVPDGTQIVILEIPKGNDFKHNLQGETTGNVSLIVSALKARNIKVLFFSNIVPADERNGDHPNAQWHATIAASLLPKVMAAMGHH